jgi:hypothetical protein
VTLLPETNTLVGECATMPVMCHSLCRGSAGARVPGRISSAPRLSAAAQRFTATSMLPAASQLCPAANTSPLGKVANASTRISVWQKMKSSYFLVLTNCGSATRVSPDRTRNEASNHARLLEREQTATDPRLHGLDEQAGVGAQLLLPALAVPAP